MVMKKVKKAAKKKTGVKGNSVHHRQHAILLDALTGLDKELGNLRVKKKAVEKRLTQIRKTIVNISNQELKLRNEISSLVEKEGKTNQKKEDAERKLAKLKTKLADVTKIKDELGNL